jgi:hypothetical protein
VTRNLSICGCFYPDGGLGANPLNAASPRANHLSPNLETVGQCLLRVYFEVSF